MRAWRLRIAVLVVGGLCLAAQAAEATSYPDALNLSTLTERAELVFLGSVISRVSGTDRVGLLATVYTFRVEQVLKGASGPTVTIKQIGAPEPVEDPATGVVTFPIHGMPAYQPGHRYLLFLNGTSDIGFTTPVGLGYGAFVVLPDGRAVNLLNNAGLLRRMPLPPARGAAAALRGHTRGPIALTALLDGTSWLVQQLSAGSARRFPEPPDLALHHIVRANMARRPRGNIGALFNGHPFRWNIHTAANPGGTLAAVPYDTETGPLGNVSNASAVAKVAESFGKWMAPSTTALIVTSTPGSLGVNVNAVCPSPTCYLNWYGFGDGKNPIIFDEDGSITQQITGSRCGFGGLGNFQGTTPDGGLTWAIESTVVLDGAWLGGVCGNLTLDQFGLTITHELGHFLTIHHTIVNGELVMAQEPFLGYGVPPCESVEIMLSNDIPGCARPNVLQKDDISIVSTLYPSASFATAMGRISGRLFASDGATPVNCGNMILRNLSDPFFDAVATITGVSKDFGTTPPPTQAGSYDAGGLTLGGSYIVGVNQIPGFASGVRLITNLCDPIPILPGPEELFNGSRESADPTIDNPNCFVPVAAGTSTSDIDIILNSAASSPMPCTDSQLGVPIATTKPATNVTPSSASVNGRVNPNGLATTAAFQWGTTTLYGNVTSSQSIGGGMAGVSVTANLTGLAPDTTYHYRVVASSSAGTAFGVDVAFATSPTHRLTVASVNPSSGVGMTLSPVDTGGLGSGTTPFSRTYGHNAVVNLTAPATVGGNTLYKWQRDGVDFSTNGSIQLTVDSEHTLTAIYIAAPGTFTDGSGPNFAIAPATTVIKTVHVVELRVAIDSLRAARGLPAFNWSDPTLNVGGTVVRAIHFLDLRMALAPVCAAVPGRCTAYTDPTLNTRQTVIRAVHLNELRANVLALR